MKGYSVVGIGALATGAAPILGGVLLAMAGGQLMGGTNFRGGIKDDLELLALLPEDQVTQREALRASIVDRVDELLVADEKRRNLRAAAVSYQGNWRDIVLFVCVVLFSIVWWDVDHARSSWLPTFVILIVAAVVTGIYAARGMRLLVTRRRK